MYLLFNNYKLLIHILFCFILISLQAFFPKIYVTNELKVSIDLLLIYLSFLVLFYKTYYIIFLAFFLGLFQDFIIHVGAIGLCSFIKPLSVFAVGLIKRAQLLWKRSFKILVIFIIYLLHFSIFYFISSLEEFRTLIFLILLLALFALIIFIVLEKLLYNSKLL